MDPKRLADLREALDGASPSFGYPLQSYTRELLAAHDCWRARCPVTAEDVVARKVTPDRALAYVQARDWLARDAIDVEELEAEIWTIVALVPTPGAGPDSSMVLRNNLNAVGLASIANACNLVAKDEGRAPHDVLDEMAAHSWEEES